MHYIHNYQTLIPNLSATQALQQQMKEADRSLDDFNAYKIVKKDSYLISELGKMQELAQLIKQSLQTLSQNPEAQSEIDFLFKGDQSQLPRLNEQLQLFDALEVKMQSKIDEVSNLHQTLRGSVQDPHLKGVFKAIDENKPNASNLFASKCKSSALAVLKSFSKWMDPQSLDQIKSLETKKVLSLKSSQKGAKALMDEIAKDLEGSSHKLYYCTFDNMAFKDSHGGHALVIEKTKENQFRLYQSFSGQYSLQSFLNEEMTKSSEGWMEYNEFYSYLKSYEFLSHVQIWDEKVSDQYEGCFKVGRSKTKGTQLPTGFFGLRFNSIQLLENERLSAIESLQSMIKDMLKQASVIADMQVLDSVGTGVCLGALVSAIALPCIAIANAL